MPSTQITATPYEGSLLSLPLFGGDSNLIVNNFDGAVSGTLADDNGTLEGSDDGVSTFNGEPLEYVGSGTYEPGLSIGGEFVSLGDAVPVVVFSAGDQTYFYFPGDEPNLLGSVVAELDITDTPYEIFQDPYAGTPDPDVMLGDGFDNEMSGQASDDIISGRAGEDTISGGVGNDTLNGNGGDDTIRGGQDADEIEGGSGADYLRGEGGIDTVSYSASGQAVTVDLSVNSVTGGHANGDDIQGFENATGSDHNDMVTGAGDDNVLRGLDGDDLLVGLGGDDTLRGGNGDDTIIGGDGDDRLIGKSGADVFVFASGGGKDKIGDFEDGIDTIELTGLVPEGMTAQEVVDTYVLEKDDLVVFRFDDGERLAVLDVTDADVLVDNLVF